MIRWGGGAKEGNELSSPMILEILIEHKNNGRGERKSDRKGRNKTLIVEGSIVRASRIRLVASRGLRNTDQTRASSPSSFFVGCMCISQLSIIDIDRSY